MKTRRLPAFAFLTGLLASVVPSQPTPAETLDARAFLGDAQEGDFWLYRLNGSQPVELRVVTLEIVEDVTSGTTLWSGGPLDGTETLSSFDSVFGSRVWWSFRPDLFVSGVGFVDQQLVFDPPLIATAPTITLGEVVTTNASVVQTFFTDFGTVVQPGTVQSRYRYAFIEVVAVPFGVFEAIQRQIEINLELEVSPGQFESVTATSRDWLVPGIGPVRIEQTFPDHTDIYELVDTSLVPEPSAVAAETTALVVMLILNWAKKRRFRVADW